MNTATAFPSVAYDSWKTEAPPYLECGEERGESLQKRLRDLCEPNDGAWLLALMDALVNSGASTEDDAMGDAYAILVGELGYGYSHPCPGDSFVYWEHDFEDLMKKYRGPTA